MTLPLHSQKDADKLLKISLNLWICVILPVLSNYVKK